MLGHTLEPSFAILLSLCFFSRGFSSFSSCRGFSCGCGLLATASASCLLLSLGHVFIKVYEFDEAHLRGIACAETCLDDAGVATGTFGGSPRASINLAKAARAYAFIKHRGYVVPEDVRAVAHDVMRHRIGLSYEAEASNVTSEEIVSKIINKVEVP